MDWGCNIDLSLASRSGTVLEGYLSIRAYSLRFCEFYVKVMYDNKQKMRR